MSHFVNSIIDVFHLGHDFVTLLAFLQSSKLVRRNLRCRECNGWCEIILKKNKFYFICLEMKKSKCNFLECLNKGTWFEKSDVFYVDVLAIVFSFVNSLSMDDTRKVKNVPMEDLEDWFLYCRDIMVFAMVSESHSSIGGNLAVVELEESTLDLSSYGRYVEENWIYCAFERNSGKFFFVPVKLRSRKSLLAIIKSRIRPGTEIISDCWTTYRCSESNLFSTLEEKQRLKFRDLDSKTCVGPWNTMKRKLPPDDVKHKNIAGHLAKFIWLRNHKKEKLFHLFMEEVSKVYWTPDFDLEREVEVPARWKRPCWEFEPQVCLKEDHEVFIKEEPVESVEGLHGENSALMPLSAVYIKEEEATDDSTTGVEGEESCGNTDLAPLNAIYIKEEEAISDSATGEERTDFRPRPHRSEDHYSVRIGLKKTSQWRGKRPYECSECGFPSSSYDEFKGHRTIHATAEFPCLKCSFVCRSYAQLKKHILSAHADS